MSPLGIGLIGLAVLFLLMAIGIPIGISFGIVGFVGTVVVVGLKPALTNLGLIPWSESITYTLMALPLFILMGEITYYSGISSDLFTTAYKWLGRIRGGLSMATIASCTGFAACSGSSLASVATMGLVAYPEMKKYGYDSKLATGSIAAGGTLAILIPPSATFIIYGVLADESIGKLFIAGMFPGLLLSLLFLSVIGIQTMINPRLGPPGPSFTWKERFQSLSGIWGMLALFLLVIGGIYLGIFTATEAAAIGAFGAFIIWFARKKFSMENLRKSMKDTGKTTCMIFLIIIGAMLFNYFLAVTGLTTSLSRWVVDLRVPPLSVVGIMLLLYIPMGMFMEALAMIVLTIPIFVPVVAALGFSPIWFGVLVVIMVEMAQITPPVGLAVYVMKGIAKDIPLTTIFKGIAPFAVADALCAAMVFAFPQIALFLPTLMR
ncbi:MAG: TRAP transporter large permease [Chloroflexi bacterium]|nr:TRAP transporter large permease [Chloroflexota bacterium]